MDGTTIIMGKFIDYRISIYLPYEYAPQFMAGVLLPEEGANTGIFVTAGMMEVGV